MLRVVAEQHRLHLRRRRRSSRRRRPGRRCGWRRGCRRRGCSRSGRRPRRSRPSGSARAGTRSTSAALCPAPTTTNRVGSVPARPSTLVQQVAAVPDPLATASTPGGQGGAQPGGEHDVAGARCDRAPVAVADRRRRRPRRRRRSTTGRDLDDLVAVADHVVDPDGGPLEVVVELDPQREQVLVVDEVDQPAAARAGSTGS